MNFAEVYEDYKIYAAKRHKKQCFDTYQRNFIKHVLPYFKDFNVENIKVSDIISWQDSIIDMNYSNNFNKNLYICFNSFLDYCVLNSYISTNLLRVVGSFQKKYEYRSYNIYTLYDYFRFRKGLKDRIYRYFYDFLFFYGVRSGECMALKFSHISGKRIHICSSINRRGKREIESPKTINSDRFLSLGLIMRLKFLILRCYYVKNYGVCSDYFIFGGIKPLSPTSIKRYKRNACDLVGVREIKVHEFRHSYATRMIKLGMPMGVLSKKLGHSSISITMDTYVHNEKRETYSLLPKLDFFDTYQRNFKKILESIITHFV